jgi:hypothetical protein
MRSIDLNFISRRDKQIPLPKLLFTEGYSAGGCCYRPWNGELYFQEKYYDLTKGLIIVNVEQASSIEACLVHEWRHLYQTYAFGINDEVRSWKNEDSSSSYKQKIVSYFRLNWRELDALRYEIKITPNECNLEWANWLGWKKK